MKMTLVASHSSLYRITERDSKSDHSPVLVGRHFVTTSSKFQNVVGAKIPSHRNTNGRSLTGTNNKQQQITTTTDSSSPLDEDAMNQDQPPPPQQQQRQPQPQETTSYNGTASATSSTIPVPPMNTTTTTTTTMTKSQQRKYEECQTCIQLLQNVLLSINTKSSKLLHHIAPRPAVRFDHIPVDDVTTTTTSSRTNEPVRLISNGVQVRIPQQPSPPQPSLTLSNTTTTDDDFNVLATTTSPSDTTTQNHSIHHHPNDWIDITCRTCSDFGPEANARAFVMGPTPLSIVICHNRISSIAQPHHHNNNTFTTTTTRHEPTSPSTPPSTPTTPTTTSAAFVSPIWNQLKSRLSTTKKITPSTENNTPNHNDTTTTTTTTTTAASHDTANITSTSGNNMMIQEMDEIITHELIHIYDVRQLHLNLVHCNDLAYSEIRAAREAECSSFHNTTHPQHHRRRQDPQQQQLADCVRTRATTATNNIFPSFRAHQCIQHVYREAMADLRPFPHPNSIRTSTSTSSNNNSSSHSHATNRTMDDSYISKK